MVRPHPALRAAPRRLGPRVVGLSVALSLVLAGCSGSEKNGERPPGQRTSGGTTLSGQWPLTGLPAEGPAPRRPVMVVNGRKFSAQELGGPTQ